MESPPKPSDIVERTILVRRDRWALVMEIAAELKEKRGIIASSEEVAAIVLDAGIETIKARTESKPGRKPVKASNPR